MKSLVTVGVIYGGLLLVGGVVGYVAKGSVVSLATGGLVGLAVLAVTWAMFRGKRSAWFGAIALAGALAVYFGRSFWISGDWMPAGSIGVLSLAVAALLALLGRRHRWE